MDTHEREGWRTRLRLRFRISARQEKSAAHQPHMPTMKRLLHFITILLTIAAFSGCAKNKRGGAGAGTDGDFVNGSPLPERQEGVSFLGSNVDRNKFAPVHFGFDSYSVSGSEQGK